MLILSDLFNEPWELLPYSFGKCAAAIFKHLKLRTLQKIIIVTNDGDMSFLGYSLPPSLAKCKKKKTCATKDKMHDRSELSHTHISNRVYVYTFTLILFDFGFEYDHCVSFFHFVQKQKHFQTILNMIVSVFCFPYVNVEYLARSEQRSEKR